MLESIAPPRLHVDRFLPPTPVRVLVDLSGKDCSQQFTHDTINKYCGGEEAFRLKQDPALLQALVPEMLSAAEKYANTQKSVRLTTAMNQAHEKLNGEANRLKELHKVNPNIRQEEIKIAETVIADVTRHIAKAHLRLDAVRLILGEPS